jgi:AcrR family transcriptional regulator
LVARISRRPFCTYAGVVVIESEFADEMIARWWSAAADGGSHDGGMTDALALPARRSSATVRLLVLQAARELFDERGYEQVGTREIAGRAGVTQAMVFRHFGTKANLFVEAVYQPFSGFVTDYIRRWADQGHGSDSSAHDTEVFVSGLYRLLLDNRKLLVALTGFLGRTPSPARVRRAGRAGCAEPPGRHARCRPPGTDGGVPAPPGGARH